MASTITSLEPDLAARSGSQRMNIVIVGHVDHGKSTVIGRLLADTHSLPEGKLEQIRAQCELNSKPFEYAFLLDALKDEQAQGITIDAARVFFKSQLRPYLILDAPGPSGDVCLAVFRSSQAQISPRRGGHRQHRRIDDFVRVCGT